MLQSRDKDLTSHSLKVTGISWAAKAEIPREQRRLLGRHSSSLQDSDSIYARDLAFAPVQAFGRMIALIRDAHFFPDSSRDSFFKGSNPLVPGRPLPRFQPMTPVMPVAQPVEKEAHLDLGVPSELIEAKEELQMPINEGKPGEIISVTESDSTTSTSGMECINSSDEDHGGAPQDDAVPDPLRQLIDQNNPLHTRHRAFGDRISLCKQ